MSNQDDLSPADAVRAATASIPLHPSALLTEVQAAEVLNVSNRTLQAWRVRGGGPRFVRLSGRAVRYRNDDLAAFIEARTVRSTSDPGRPVDAPAAPAGGLSDGGEAEIVIPARRESRSKDTGHARRSAIASGPDGALIASALALAADAWRWGGEKDLEIASRPPAAAEAIGCDVKAAAAARKVRGEAANTLADAIDAAVQLPAESEFAFIDLDKFAAAVKAYERFGRAQRRAVEVFAMMPAAGSA